MQGACGALAGNFRGQRFVAHRQKRGFCRLRQCRGACGALARNFRGQHSVARRQKRGFLPAAPMQARLRRFGPQFPRKTLRRTPMQGACGRLASGTGGVCGLYGRN
jgi:hypothetical protein